MKNQKKDAAERLWLEYFNRYLLEHGLITAEVHRRLAAQLSRRSS